MTTPTWEPVEQYVLAGEDAQAGILMPSETRAVCRELLTARALLAECEVLLREVRPRDCGAHYCRYCRAKSPEWAHDPYCAYEESRTANERASDLRTRLRAHVARLTEGWCIR